MDRENIDTYLLNRVAEDVAKDYSIPANVVCRWDVESKSLVGSQIRKARKFVKEGKIKYDNEAKLFYCEPLDNYNKTTYTIKTTDGYMECNCQWFNKNGLRCSHILALLLFFKVKHNEVLEKWL